jgi:RHS repeat-associated protein
MGCLRIHTEIFPTTNLRVSYGNSEPHKTRIVNLFENDFLGKDYYPFGMEIPALSSNSSEYRYGFNGMEKDDEVKGKGNSINYKARIQDTRLGRFFAVDPLTSQFAYYSPYQFAGNIPTMAIDLDGKEEYIVHKMWNKTKTGYYLKVIVTYNREIKRRSKYGHHKNRKADLYLNGKYIKSEINKFEEGTWLSNTVESYTDITYSTEKDAISKTNGTSKTLKESMDESNGSGLKSGYSNIKRKVELFNHIKGDGAKDNVELFYNTDDSFSGEQLDQGVLDIVGNLMDNPELNISITGHTSRKGDADYNNELSLKRANDISARIIEKATEMGASANVLNRLKNQISTSGGGETRATDRGAADGTNNEKDRSTTVEYSVKGI